MRLVRHQLAHLLIAEAAGLSYIAAQ